MSIKSQYMFTNANHIYSKYKSHGSRGFVILGPPASGKTTFIKSQKIPNWIDTDDLFSKLNLNWHINETNSVDFKLNYMRADYLLEQSKMLGFRLIGSLYYNYIPDAIIIPPIMIHEEYINKRNNDNDYPLDKDNVYIIRNELIKKAKNNNIPIFKTCNEAVRYCDQLN